MGPHCSLCGTFTGPFSQIEGLFTALICLPCLEVRLAQPDTLLGLHDPGQPWEWLGRARGPERTVAVGSLDGTQSVVTTTLPWASPSPT